MTNYTFTTFIQRGDDELELCVTYTVSPYIAQTNLQPAEGGDCEITQAEFVGIDAATMPAPLTDAEYDALQIECEERAGSDERDAAADYADYLYEQHRDRQMMENYDD